MTAALGQQDAQLRLQAHEPKLYFIYGAATGAFAEPQTFPNMPLPTPARLRSRIATGTEAEVEAAGDDASS